MGAPPARSIAGDRIGAPSLHRRLRLGGSRPEVASGAERALGAAGASEPMLREGLLHVLHTDVHGVAP